MTLKGRRFQKWYLTGRESHSILAFSSALNLEVQSVIYNPIFITKNHFKGILLACHFPPMFTNTTRSGIGAKTSIKNEKNNQSCNIAYLFQPRTFNLNGKNSNGLLHLTITFTDKRLVYRHHTPITINAISQLETELVKKSSFSVVGVNSFLCNILTKYLSASVKILLDDLSSV